MWGYIEYHGGVFSTVGDIMSTMGGGVFSTVGDIMSTVGGYLEYRGNTQLCGGLS